MAEEFKSELEAGIAQFNLLYKKSTETRKKACEIYATLSNGDPVADAAFRAQHPEWTTTQWRILFLVGTGVLYEGYLNLHVFSVSLYISKLPIDQQKKYYHEGVPCLLPAGSVRNIKIGNVHGEMIRQLFCDDGHLRTVKEQEAYLNELEEHRKAAIKNDVNWTVYNGGILVRRANIKLTPDDLREALMRRRKKPLLSPAVLREIADFWEERERKANK